MWASWATKRWDIFVLFLAFFYEAKTISTGENTKPKAATTNSEASLSVHELQHLSPFSSSFLNKSPQTAPHPSGQNYRGITGLRSFFYVLIVSADS